MTSIKRVLRILSAGLALLAATSSASAQPVAQTWPRSPVRLIVPLPPGTGADIAGRLLAERLSQRWGQPVIVENRPGGDGIPAVTSFLAARDPHQLLLSFAGIVTINPLTYPQLPYDPQDLVPIVPVLDGQFGVSASPAIQADALSDLISIARRQPGALNWAATPGLPHYVMLALQRSAGIQMVQVPYREFGPAFRISRKAGCRSPPPPCRCCCRTIGRAQPGSCS